MHELHLRPKIKSIPKDASIARVLSMFYADLGVRRPFVK